METRTLTQAEMAARTARFAELKPQSRLHSSSGIPEEAYEFLTAKTLYLLMAPMTQGGPMAQRPAIEGEDGMSVIIARCPPGDKPALHAHFKTHETFFCLTGRFRIRWGDAGEQDTILEPFDMIAVPPGICRDFCNISDQEALLLVLITGRSNDDFNDVAVAPGESQEALARFGPQVIQHFRERGTEFMGLAD